MIGSHSSSSAGERADDAGLGLAALAQEDDVVPGQEGVLQLRHDRLLVAQHAARRAGSPEAILATALRRTSSLTGRDCQPDSRSWPRVAGREDMPGTLPPSFPSLPPRVATSIDRVRSPGPGLRSGRVWTCPARGARRSPTTTCAATPSNPSTTTAAGSRSPCPGTGGRRRPSPTRDGPLIYRTRFELDTGPERRPPLARARRHLLPGRRVARRRLPRRSRGLLLPPRLRDHRPRPAWPPSTCCSSRSRARRSRTGERKRNITGVFQHWDCIDPDWNPGGLWRPVRVERTGPVRIDRLRVICHEASEDRAVLQLRGRARHRPGPQRSASARPSTTGSSASSITAWPRAPTR